MKEYMAEARRNRRYHFKKNFGNACPVLKPRIAIVDEGLATQLCTKPEVIAMKSQIYYVSRLRLVCFAQSLRSCHASKKSMLLILTR